MAFGLKWLSEIIFGKAAKSRTVPQRAELKRPLTEGLPVYTPAADWTEKERRHYELVGVAPMSVNMREREKAAILAAKAPFIAIQRSAGKTTLEQMAMTGGPDGDQLFLNVDGFVFSSASKPLFVANVYEHDLRPSSRIVEERLGKAGQMLVGNDTLVVYDNDGSVYVGPRHQDLQGRKIDLVGQLQRMGYTEYKKSGPEVEINSPDYKPADALETLTDGKFVVITKMDSRFANPEGDKWEPDHAFHTEMMTKLGRQPLSETDFMEASKFRGLSARDIKPTGGGSQPGGM